MGDGGWIISRSGWLLELLTELTIPTKGKNTWLSELVFALLTSRSLTYAFDRPASIPDGPIF